MAIFAMSERQKIRSASPSPAVLPGFVVVDLEFS
jgi:hypothetical protein